jgi:hypothetical protein
MHIFVLHLPETGALNDLRHFSACPAYLLLNMRAKQWKKIV